MKSARREDGQSLVVVIIFLFLVIGMAGIVIDVAELYLTQRHLQSAADSAALAAAQDLPNSSLTACTYSASGIGDTCANGSDPASTMTSNGMNYRASFGSIQTTATLECLSVASAGTQCRMGDACPESYQPAGGESNLGCNAIKVREETTVTPFFMGAFGFGGTKVSATATASIAGGAPHPLNVEIIDDTTPSMQTHDTCGGVPTDVPASEANDLTQEDCAKAGIRSLLTELTPCYPPLSVCDTSDALDRVGLVTFPALKSPGTGAAAWSDGVVPGELDCTKNIGGSDETYTPSDTSYSNFQQVPFSNNFRVTTQTLRDPLGSLNTADPLVRAVYWPGDGCGAGGYPIPSNGSATSIAGGAAADTTTTNNNGGTTIAVAGNSKATGSGISQGNSQPAVNTSGVGVVRGSSTTATNGTGGGPNSGDSGDSSTLARTSTSSISPGEPDNTNNGDFLLATITGQGNNVTQNSSICAPNGWTIVDQTQVSGTVIQATYSTTAQTARRRTSPSGRTAAAVSAGT